MRIATKQLETKVADLTLIKVCSMSRGLGSGKKREKFGPTSVRPLGDLCSRFLKLRTRCVASGYF